MDRIVIGSFWTFAVVYLATMHLGPYPAHGLVKAIPALSLALLVLLRLDGKHRVLLAAALVFSAGGDIVLSSGEAFFVAGLGLFLVAHLCYIGAFALDRAYQPARLGVLLGVVAVAITMAVFLAPRLGDMRVPVLVYIAVITGMVITATLNTRGGWLLIVGALLFLLSDATIAVNRFLVEAPHPAASYIIMPTYYGAQYCIAMAFVRQRRR